MNIKIHLYKIQITLFLVASFCFGNQIVATASPATTQETVLEITNDYKYSIGLGILGGGALTRSAFKIYKADAVKNNLPWSYTDFAKQYPKMLWAALRGNDKQLAQKHPTFCAAVKAYFLSLPLTALIEHGKRPYNISSRYQAKQKLKNQQLIKAAKATNPNAIKQALINGADVDTRNYLDSEKFYCTSLHILCCQGGRYLGERPSPKASQCIEILLDHGADKESNTCNYFTPLACACNNRNPEAIKLLLERGAKVDVQVQRDIFFTYSPLNLLCKSPYFREEDPAEICTLVELLLEYGADKDNTEPLASALKSRQIVDPLIGPIDGYIVGNQKTGKIPVRTFANIELIRELIYSDVKIDQKLKVDPIILQVQREKINRFKALCLLRVKEPNNAKILELFPHIRWHIGTFLGLRDKEYKTFFGTNTLQIITKSSKKPTQHGLTGVNKSVSWIG